MTDPNRKPETAAPEGSAQPSQSQRQSQGAVPDWVDAMTGPSLSKEPAATPTDPFTPLDTPAVGERHTYAPAPGPTSSAPGASPYGPPPQLVGSTTDSKKIVAGILGILLGSLGVHKFYLGIQQPAIIMLCVTLGCWLLTIVTFGIAGLITIPVIAAVSIVGLVEGIIYLTKTDAQFRQEYEIGKKPWF